MNLSPHFTLAEFTQSQTAARKGISNTPTPAVIECLKLTALGLEGVRTLLGSPITVNSGYRSPALNKAIGGSAKSQHVTGEAVDFICPGFGSPLEVCRAIVKSGIKFDQMIYEGTWVHISFCAKPRGDVLTAHFNASGVSYTRGLS